MLALFPLLSLSKGGGLCVASFTCQGQVDIFAGY
jgi:hypothetical protein